MKVPGRLKAVRAIGWYIEQYRQAQVSINLINYKTTPLHVVFETVREEAEKLGLIVTGSELVGLMPLQPLIDAGTFYLRKQGKSTGVPEREVVETAVRSLGLDQLAAFDPDKKVIEYQFRKRGALVVDAGGPLRRRGVVRVARARRRVGGRAGRKPGGGALGDGREPDGRQEGIRGGVGRPVRGRRARAGGEGPAGARGGRGHRRVQPGDGRDADAQGDAGGAGRARTRRSRPATSRPPACRSQTARRASRRWRSRSWWPSKGNTNSASDAGVAALMARAGVEGAVLNVLINLGSVKDEAFKQACRDETGQLANEAAAACDQITAKVRSTFA